MSGQQNETEAVLWERYGNERTDEMRQQLAARYLGLVRYVVSQSGLPSRAKGSGMDREDLVHAGVLGLMRAIERFNPSVGVKFETFAVPRIRGEILDELRRLDWVPRSVRLGTRKAAKAAAALSQDQGREPLAAEVARALSLSLEDYHRLLATAEIVLMDEGTGGTEDIPETSAPTPLEALADDEARKLLAEALSRMPSRESAIVSLYYYEGLTFQEIGKVLQISESRVSQLHAEIIRSLRAQLSEIL